MQLRSDSTEWINEQARLADLPRIKNHNNRSVCLFVLSVLTLETEGWAQNLTVSLTSCVTWGQVTSPPRDWDHDSSSWGPLPEVVGLIIKPPSMLLPVCVPASLSVHSDPSRVGSRICMCYVLVLSMYYERCPGQGPGSKNSSLMFSSSHVLLVPPSPNQKAEARSLMMWSAGQPLGSEWRRVEVSLKKEQIASVLTHCIFCREISIQVLWPFLIGCFLLLLNCRSVYTLDLVYFELD